MARAPGEGGIYWSESRQRWVAAWKGRKRYARTRSEAARKLVDLKASDGQRVRTVGDLLDWWTGEHLPMLLANDVLAANTVRDYVYTVAMWEPLRRIRVEKLTAADIDRRLEQLRKTPTRVGTGYSASNRRTALVALRRAFKAARQAGLLPPGRTAPEDATPPPVRTTEPPLVDVPTAFAVLEQLAGHRDERLILLTLSLGVRISEALGLAWDAVDLERGTVRIHRQLQRVDGRWELKDKTKGKRSVVLALPQVAAEALREQRRVQAEERLAAGPFWADPFGLVFTRADGQPIWSTSVVKTIQQACQAAGVPPMTTHQFTRHGYATLQRMLGASLDDIRGGLNHAQAHTTERYAHVLPEVHRRNADRIDQALRRPGRVS